MTRKQRQGVLRPSETLVDHPSVGVVDRHVSRDVAKSLKTQVVRVDLSSDVMSTSQSRVSLKLRSPDPVLGPLDAEIVRGPPRLESSPTPSYSPVPRGPTSRTSPGPSSTEETEAPKD